ncbi:MAG: hypothetical protein KDK41_10050 [Leptospiraceae bacterium]|nr:hypothetical protein [Leptospiraceae bacterium]
MPCLILLGLTLHSSLSAKVQIRDRWNQFNEEHHDGYQDEHLKLSAGSWIQQAGDANSITLLSGRFEYFTNNYFGFRGETAIPLSSSPSGFSYFPLALGLSIHMFPRSMFDFYFGGDSGFVNITLPNAPSGWFARTSLHTGLSFYFWGSFFIEYELRYAMVHYAKTIPLDMSGLGHSIHIGFYF